jgi:type II secretory pathway predicted ATPase ExeA
MPGVYESFYKLTTDPFRLSPDHRFSFGHPSYTKAKAYMQYALQRGEGFIMVTGAPGTGKTTLINDMLSQIDETRVTVVSLLSTRLRPDDMLHMVATTLGLQCDESRKSALLVKIKEALTQQHRMQPTSWRNCVCCPICSSAVSCCCRSFWLGRNPWSSS